MALRDLSRLFERKGICDCFFLIGLDGFKELDEEGTRGWNWAFCRFGLQVIVSARLSNVLQRFCWRVQDLYNQNHLLT